MAAGSDPLDPLECFELWLQARLEEVHTTLPGIVQSYDAKTRTATVKPRIKLRSFHGDILDIPPIPSVPVVWPSTSGFSVFGKLKAGDGVILHVFEASAGNWQRGTSDAEAEDETRFSLQDMVAIPGLWQMAKVPKHDRRKADWAMASEKLSIGGTEAGLAVMQNGESDLRKELERIMDEVKALREDLRDEFTLLSTSLASDAGFLFQSVANTATFAAVHTAALVQIEADRLKLQKLLA